MSSSDNHASFEQTLRPHLERLYRLAYRLTGHRPEAEDLVQDVLTKLFCRGDELSSIDDLSPWLGRVLYNQFVDNRRRYRKRLRLVENARESADPFEAIASDVASPEDEADRALDISRLQSALEQLSEDHRTVVLLHDTEGYKLAEIQRFTGVPVGTLKSRLHRARARLRELLAEMEPSGRDLRDTG